ncbi:MAG: c-type cytochrome [Gammaproteobacteria bacterium]|nr:c-type cytochrome [Gammaproteobacteria bacterium]MBU1414438.1 c-type cytochrome [Gammaproteobacteria bacterium]
MSPEDIGFLLVGFTAVVVAATVIVMLVKSELAVAAGEVGKSSGGRLVLAVALGMGVIAFSFKLTVFTLMSALPKQTIDRVMVERHFAQIVPASWSTMPPIPLKEEPYQWQALPYTAPAPPDNPTTPEKIALGKRLFFDPNLSLTRDVACASCHDVTGGTGIDSRRTSMGIRGQIGGRNAPTVWNAAFQAVLFWDGRAASLEDQAKGPPLNPIEMGMPSGEAVAQRVRDNPAYEPLFEDAFGMGTSITFDRVAQAIAAYERTLITPDAPYDRFVRGDRTALTPAQLRGMALFQTTGCVSCHSGANFSGASFVNLKDGDPPAAVAIDNGFLRMFPGNDTPYAQKYNLTADIGAGGPNADRGVWRIPSLRNVALTPPYLHNGAVDSLEEVVRIMATSQLGATIDGNSQHGRVVFWSPEQQRVSKVDRPVLNDRDIKDLVAFLNSLSSDGLAQQVAARQRK